MDIHEYQEQLALIEELKKLNEQDFIPQLYYQRETDSST